MRINTMFFLLMCFGVPVSSQSLIDYKNSAHPLFVGFLVGGDDPVAATLLPNIPDSVDMVEMFGRYDTARADWQAIQAKGTKIIKCVFPNTAYFDGSVKDPATKLPGYTPPPGLDSTKPVAGSTYYHYARELYAKYITDDHWDGLDVDIESGTFSRDVPLSNAPGFLRAVAQYFGPNCTSCSIAANGKKPILIYDTDGSADDDNNYKPTKNNYDYVFFQAYTNGHHFWKGRGVADIPALAAYYGIAKFVPMVNGDDWLHANGSQDEPPAGDATTTSDLLDYARWCKQHGGGGIGAYRMSRDYNHTPPFGASRTAIQILNPAVGKTNLPIPR
jgi:hypothetical protein